jgi:hypothetical protein
MIRARPPLNFRRKDALLRQVARRRGLDITHGPASDGADVDRPADPGAGPAADQGADTVVTTP